MVDGNIHKEKPGSSAPVLHIFFLFGIFPFSFRNELIAPPNFLCGFFISDAKHFATQCLNTLQTISPSFLGYAVRLEGQPIPRLGRWQSNRPPWLSTGELKVSSCFPFLIDPLIKKEQCRTDDQNNGEIDAVESKVITMVDITREAISECEETVRTD